MYHGYLGVLTFLVIPSWSLRSASPAPSELLTQPISYHTHGELGFQMNVHLIFRFFFSLSKIHDLV